MTKKNAVNIILSLLLAFTPPLFFIITLKAYDNYAIPAAFVLLSNLLFFVRYKTGLKPAWPVNILLISGYTVFAVLILIYTIFIPYSSYDAWLKFIGMNLNGGSISYLFVIGMSYFSSIFAGLVYKHGYLRPIAGLISCMIILNLIVYQNLTVFIAAAASIFLCVSALIVLNRKFNFNSQFTAAKLFIAVFILSSLLTLLNIHNSKWLSGYSLLPRFRNIFTTLFPNLPIEIGEAKKSFGGITIDQYVMGGKPLLTNREIFRISGSRGTKLYLRCEVYDYFTGYTWQKSEKLLEKTPGYELFRFSKSDVNDIEITTLADYYYLLPHTLDTTGIKLEGQYLPRLVYGSFDTGYALKLPLIKNTKIILSRASNNLKTNYNEAALGYYLQIPDLLKNDVRNLAKKLSKNAETKTDILNNIDDFLKRDFVYSLNTNPPSGSYDFVEDFLFNQKKGFCEHFATAFVILARLNDIPARYVTGYLITLPIDKDSAMCTGYNDHSWAEVYLEGRGWTTWESTPPMQTDANLNKLIIDRNDNLTIAQIKEILDEKGQTRSLVNCDFKNIKIILTVIVSILTALLIIFITIVILYKTACLKSARGKIVFYSRKIISKSKKMKIPHPSVTGWRAWGESFKVFRGIKASHAARFTKIIENSFYGNILPGKKELKFIRLFYNHVKKSF